MSQTEERTPEISLVIPAFNASAHIVECLDHVFASKFKKFETILVDDCSTDDTLVKVRGYPCRTLKNETHGGAAHSRNRGITAAQTDLILLIDSDVLIPPDFISRVRNYFVDRPDISILQACYDHKPYYQNLLSQYKHYVFSFRGAHPGGTYVSYVHTACVAIRREISNQIRFNENLSRREDIDFGLRCSENGFRICADPSLVVRHKKRYTFASYSKYQFKAAKELMIQQLVLKNKNFTQELSLKKQPFYKKAWLLRPVLCVLAVLSLILFGLTKNVFWGFLFILVTISSFLLEYQFRWYLLRVAPLSVSLGAWPLYFYDGFLLGLGGVIGTLQALFRKTSTYGNHSNE